MTRDEWREERRGKVSASQIHRIVLGGSGAWQTYLDELRAERAGCELREISAPALDWGHKYEPEARAMFEIEHGITVDGALRFITHPELPDVGCSPDGLIDDDGGLELKCPYKPEVHEQYRAENVVPYRYVPQVQSTLWITGRRYWWFASYDPRVTDTEGHLIGDLFPICVARDEGFIQRIEAKVREFLELLESGNQPTNLDPTTDTIPNLF